MPPALPDEFCCGKCWDRRALSRHRTNTRKCQRFKARRACPYGCGQQVPTRMRREHAIECELRLACNDRPLLETVNGLRVFNLMGVYLREKFVMAEPYEGRKVRQAGVDAGSWVFLSMTKSSPGDAGAGLILGLARVESISSHSGEEWPVHYNFATVYSIKTLATYSGAQAVLNNPFGSSSIQGLAEEVSAHIRAYAQAKLAAAPRAW